MGRRRIEMKEVKDPATKQITFSKRRRGLFKKANELSILCGIEIAVAMFSPGNKPFSFGHPSVDAVAAKWLQQEPKSNVAKSNEVGDMHGLNKQLCDVEAQICEEKNKTMKLDKSLKQHEVTKASQYEDLQDFHCKVKDYLDEMEVSECLLLLAQEPVVGITKQVPAKKRRRTSLVA